eukprot:15434348-Alexandrium_andersonii.AAC.1
MLRPGESANTLSTWSTTAAGPAVSRKPSASAAKGCGTSTRGSSGTRAALLSPRPTALRAAQRARAARLGRRCVAASGSSPPEELSIASSGWGTSQGPTAVCIVSPEVLLRASPAAARPAVSL